MTLASQAVIAVAGLAGIRLITKLAPPAVFGEATLLLGVLQLVRTTFTAPCINAQTRLHPDYDRVGLGDWFTRQMTRYTWIATAMFLVPGIAAYVAWRLWAGGGMRPALFLALLGFPIVDSLRGPNLIRWNAERRQARSAAWTAAEAVLLVGCCAAALWISPTPEAYITGQWLSVTLVMVGFALWVPPARPAPDVAAADDPGLEAQRAALRHELPRRFFRYGLPFVPMLGLSWMYNMGDRYLLEHFRAAADVGAYAAAYSLASRPMLMMGGLLNSVTRPILFRAESDREFDKARRVFLLWVGAAAAAGAIGTLLVWLTGRWLVWLLLAPAYRSSAPAVLTWVAAGYAAYTVVQVIENRLMSLGRSGTLLWPLAVAAAFNLGIDLVLIPRFGGVGAAAGTLAAFALHALLLMVALSRSWRAPIAAADDGPSLPPDLSGPADATPAA